MDIKVDEPVKIRVISMSKNTPVYAPETEAELYYFGKLQAAKAEISLLRVQRRKDDAYIEELKHENERLRKVMSEYYERMSIVELIEKYKGLNEFTKKAANKFIKICSQAQRRVLDHYQGNLVK